jgi:Thaumatin family
MFGGQRQRKRLFRMLTVAVATAAVTSACGGPGIQFPGAPGAAVGAASGTTRGTAIHVPVTTPVSTAAKPARARLAGPSAPATVSVSAPPSPAVSAPPPTGTAGSPASGPAAGGTRLVTFVNRMSETIWVAAAPNPATPLAASGWVLPAGGSVTIAAPNNLNTRFWGRTGCVFNSAGVGHCQTGDCGGLFQCKGWGQIPATLAEVNFDAWDGLDFYDVSMVDGSNLPMYINITKSSGGTVDKVSPDGCVPAGCTKPVDCPAALDVTAGGEVVGCISACARFGTDQYCCRGQWSSRAACDPAKWPVDYAAVFKHAEPYAYSYVDDDATSVFTCAGRCDYRITFGITP